MIRKMLVIAAAVAMPATAMAGITAVGGAGIASAKALPPQAVTCTLSGTIAFPKGGLSKNGVITNKTTGTTKTAITPGGGLCGSKAIKSKITSATTACWSTLPVLTGKVVTSPGVLTTDPNPPHAVTAAAACLVGATDPSTMTATQVKTAIKDQFYLGTLAGLLSGPSQILASLAGGVPAVDNGTKITLMPTAASSVVPGGSCGASEAGFAISGPVTGGGAVTAFAMNICLGADTGTNVGGTAFFSDFVAATANPAVVITGASLDPATSSIALS